MIEYQVEDLKECLEEMKPLFEEHYAEIAMYQDKVSLDPSYDRYLELAEAGVVHIITVRDDSKLVGYCVSILLPHLHYKNDLFASNDIVYLDEAYRKDKVGLGLFLFVEKTMKDLGVSVITMHTKVKQPFDTLCEGLDYDYAERIYSKYVGE